VIVLAELGLTVAWDRLSRDRRSESTLWQLIFPDAGVEPAWALAGLGVLAGVELLELHAAVSIMPASSGTTIVHPARLTIARRRPCVVVDSLLIASLFPRPAPQSSPPAGDVRDLRARNAA
jgi:hypothetical protein